MLISVLYILLHCQCIEIVMNKHDNRSKKPFLLRAYICFVMLIDILLLYLTAHYLNSELGHLAHSSWFLLEYILQQMKTVFKRKVKLLYYICSFVKKPQGAHFIKSH